MFTTTTRMLHRSLYSALVDSKVLFQTCVGAVYCVSLLAYNLSSISPTSFIHEDSSECKKKKYSYSAGFTNNLKHWSLNVLLPQWSPTNIPITFTFFLQLYHYYYHYYYYYYYHYHLLLLLLLLTITIRHPKLIIGGESSGQAQVLGRGRGSCTGSSTHIV